MASACRLLVVHSNAMTVCASGTFSRVHEDKKAGYCRKAASDAADAQRAKRPENLRRSGNVMIEELRPVFVLRAIEIMMNGQVQIYISRAFKSKNRKKENVVSAVFPQFIYVF